MSTLTEEGGVKESSSGVHGQQMSPQTAMGTVAGTSPPAVSVLWPCLCGARNRLRDTACRHCGTHKP